MRICLSPTSGRKKGRFCTKKWHTMEPRSGSPTGHRCWLGAQKSKTTLGSKGLLRGGRPHGATRKPNEDHLTVITRSPHRAVEYDRLENRVLRAWWGLDLRGAQRKVCDVVPLPNEHWLMTSPSTLFELDANNRMVWQYSPPLDPSDERDSMPLFKAMFRAPDGTVYGN